MPIKGVVIGVGHVGVACPEKLFFKVGNYDIRLRVVGHGNRAVTMECFR